MLHVTEIYIYFFDKSVCDRNIYMCLDSILYC